MSASAVSGPEFRGGERARAAQARNRFFWLEGKAGAGLVKRGSWRLLSELLDPTAAAESAAPSAALSSSFQDCVTPPPHAGLPEQKLLLSEAPVAPASCAGLREG